MDLNSFFSSLSKYAPEWLLVFVLTPEIIRHYREEKDKQNRIHLHLYEINPTKEAKPVYGLEHIPTINRIDDIIDRIRNPGRYKILRAGNEILIDGPAQSGKKSLAIDIAKRAKVDRIIIVDDLSDRDVLARANVMIKRRFWKCAARGLTGRGFNPGKTMVLMAGIDRANGHKGYQAIIDTAETRPDVVIISTTTNYLTNSDIANQHGVILHLPIASSPAWHTMMQGIAEGYLLAAERSWSNEEKPRLWNGSSRKDVIAEILQHAQSPGDIEDIVEQCQQSIIYEQHEVPIEKQRNFITILHEDAIPRVTSANSVNSANQNKRAISPYASVRRRHEVARRI